MVRRPGTTKRNISPTLIAKYQTQLIDKQILQEKLQEFYEIAEENLKEEKSLE